MEGQRRRQSRKQPAAARDGRPQRDDAAGRIHRKVSERIVHIWTARHTRAKTIHTWTRTRAPLDNSARAPGSSPRTHTNSAPILCAANYSLFIYELWAHAAVVGRCVCVCVVCAGKRVECATCFIHNIRVRGADIMLNTVCAHADARVCDDAERV